ncbi:hypothetical protein D3C76_51890 [compost metagenome]
MTTYRTIQGDTWDGIAYKLTGNSDFVTRLMTANIAYINTVIFSAGVELVVPEVEIKSSDVLPPWRREESV